MWNKCEINMYPQSNMCKYVCYPGMLTPLYVIINPRISQNERGHDVCVLNCSYSLGLYTWFRIIFPLASFLHVNLSNILSVGAAATPAELREHLIQKLRLVLASGSDEECSVCLDSLRLPVITHCAHVYCRSCITQVIGTEQVRVLPSAGSRCL